uniref:Uncharacterized protein n=1 Tax=Anguilla anguilla TaxID=7936 RepID=A0A0E9W204_ANGAN
MQVFWFRLLLINHLKTSAPQGTKPGLSSLVGESAREYWEPGA